MKQKDYYEILGVSRDIDEKAIKRAYRRLAMKFHPDRNPGKQKEANEKFKEINEAYAVLGDPEKRKQYDQFGTVGDVGDIFASSHTRPTVEDLIVTGKLTSALTSWMMSLAAPCGVKHFPSGYSVVPKR